MRNSKKFVRKQAEIDTNDYPNTKIISQIMSLSDLYGEDSESKIIVILLQTISR